jgi:hypothetical protein
MRAISVEPPLTLAEAASRSVPRVRLVCAKCRRRGDYAVSRLRERFGEATLIKVRERSGSSLWSGPTTASAPGSARGGSPSAT